METFFQRVCEHARELLEPRLKALDHIAYGGERHTTLALRARCHFLKQLDGRTLDLLLDVRHPRQATLEEAAVRVWSSAVLEWEPSSTGVDIGHGSR